jgi:hypothetical protein
MPLRARAFRMTGVEFSEQAAIDLRRLPLIQRPERISDLRLSA